MNAPATTIPETTKPADNTVLIGIHFSIPPLPQIDLFVWQHTPATFSTIAMALTFALRRAALIESKSGVGAHGTLNNGLILVRTFNRNAALELIGDFLKSCLGHFESSDTFTIYEVAYQTADGVYYTVIPRGCSQRFERWLVEAHVAERHDRSTNPGDWVRALIDVLASAPSDSHP